ncbi:hypothetical protein JVU11DRAFT_8516 [Chiua virens]|nr:hypothetical protein JVU11DRAFT_8516 [Chiua virens]
MPRSPQELYTRLLSSLRGYPLWTPEPSHELLMRRRDGFRIGDVGVVTDDGGFDVLFNICLPQDHSFHHPHGVPEGFTYIDESGLDIRTIPNAERRGGVISIPSVTRVETSESWGEGTQRHGSNALSYRFILSSDEGALLILPEGAERRDLLDEGVFLEQASKHGAKWYNYAVNRRHRIINHDSLYLLTGLSKTRSWSVATFDHDFGNRPAMPAHFKHIGGDITASSYGWETARPLDWRVGPHYDHGIPDQTVFVRGFKIAIRKGLLGTRWISVEADVPSTRHNPVQSPVLSPALGYSILSQG